MNIEIKHAVVMLSAACLVVMGSVASAQEDSQTSAESEPKYEHGRKHKGHARHKRRMKELLKRIDTNEDGKVDLAEYLAHSEKRFQGLDLDNDGYVTRDESREAHKMMREKFREAREEKRKGASQDSDQGEYGE